MRKNIPTVKQVLTAVRRDHYPGAATIEVGERAHRGYQPQDRVTTWNELEWAEEADLDDLVPLRLPLHGLRLRFPLPVRLDLYVYSGGEFGELLGNVDLDITTDGTATLTTFGRDMVRHTTNVKAG